MSAGYFGGIPGSPGGPLPSNFPNISVEVAFNDYVWATAPAWTDITRYVLSFTTSIGRQHELQQVNPSTAVIQLTNQPVSTADPGGRFSPWNSGSPFYNSGNGLTPGHPVRILTTIGSTTYNVFYGYTQSWVPAYGQSQSSVTLNCYDAMALLNLAYMDVSLYPATVITDGATAYWECQDPAGSRTFADDTGHGNTASVFGGGTFGGTAGSLQAVSDGCFTTNAVTGGFLVTGSAMMLTPIGPQSVSHVMFEGAFKTTGTDQMLMSWTTNSTSLARVALYLDSNGTPVLAASSFGAPFAPSYVLAQSATATNDGAWHDYVVTVPCTDSTGTYVLFVDGVRIGSGAGDGTFQWTGTPALDFVVGGYYGAGFGVYLAYANFVGSWDQIAYYQTPLSRAQVANHHAIRSAGFVVQDSGSRTFAVLEGLAGVPSGLINCDTGVVVIQGASNPLSQTTVASYLQQVTNTERGITYQDTSGVVQFKNRNHVYTNANSVNSQVTFTYDGSGEYYYSQGLVPAEDDTDEWNDINVSRQGGANQNASDPTSIAKYGKRSLTGYTSLLFEYDADALDLAQGLLYQYKNPSPRVRALKTSSIINDGAALPKVLGLNLLDRVTIIWKPLDGSTVAFNQPSLVEQVTHTVTPGQWDTTLAVTPIGTETFGLWNSGLWNIAIWGF